MDRKTQVLMLAETIDLPESLRTEIACLAVEFDEPWEEVLSEALSELRSMRGHSCSDCPCQAAEAEVVTARAS